MVDVGEMMKKWEPLVYHIARKHFAWFIGGGLRLSFIRCVDFDDLMQSGRMGLYTAISKFSESGGASFKTYAYNGIYREMLHCVTKTPKQNEFSKKYKRKAITPLNAEWVAGHTANDESAADGYDEAVTYIEYTRTLVCDDDLKALLEHHDGKQLRELAKERKISRQAMSARLIRARAKAAVAIARERRLRLKVA